MISLFLCGLSFFHTKERVALMVSLVPGVPILLTCEIWFFFSVPETSVCKKEL